MPYRLRRKGKIQANLVSLRRDHGVPIRGGGKPVVLITIPLLRASWENQVPVLPEMKGFYMGPSHCNEPQRLRKFPASPATGSLTTRCKGFIHEVDRHHQAA